MHGTVIEIVDNPRDLAPAKEQLHKRLRVSYLKDKRNRFEIMDKMPGKPLDLEENNPMPDCIDNRQPHQSGYIKCRKHDFL
jgi:hypothetical protein